jgi:hypothetical protein
MNRLHIPYNNKNPNQRYLADLRYNNPNCEEAKKN